MEDVGGRQRCFVKGSRSDLRIKENKHLNVVVIVRNMKRLILNTHKHVKILPMKKYMRIMSRL